MRPGMHDHPFYELGMVLSGKCTWHLGRRRIALQSGDAILIKPKVSHGEEIKCGEEARLAWVGFDFAGPAPAWSQRLISTAGDFPEVAGYFDILASEHHRPDYPSFHARIGLAAQSLLLLVARRAEDPGLARRDRSPDRVGSELNPRQIHRVESAAHYFRTNLRDALSIAQVAAYHSLCPAHFSSLFQRHHGVSPRTFLRLARLERAAGLLRDSDLSLKEIAVQCGFVDAAHFCKSFRQEHGLTPRRFRMAPR